MQTLIHAAVFVAFSLPVLAGQVHTKQITFDEGKNAVQLSGVVAGEDTVLYKLHAEKGHFLSIAFETKNQSADFNLYVPGRGMGDEALFASAVGGRTYLGQVRKSGDHSITVFLNRNAARKGDKAKFTMQVKIDKKAPVPKEETPAVGPVPQKVIDDCLAALKKQIPDRKMSVRDARRGEACYIIEVDVEGVPKPWKCFHDGSQCTGTEYQGEG